MSGRDDGRGVPWLDRILLAAAAIFGVLALIVGDVDALDRPTRDGVELLPVWGVEVCRPLPAPDDAVANRPRCRWFARPELDGDTCEPIARAARARFKGETARCVVDPERLLAVRGLVPGAPLSGIPNARASR